MKNVIAIIKKELGIYFNSPTAYIFLTVFLVLSSWMYLRTLFLINQADMRSYFDLVPWIFMFLIPAISMKMWAEEKKLGTIEILMTWPVKDIEMVIGKFLASFIFLIIAISGSVILPIILSQIGNPDWGQIMGSYLGTLFLGATFLAIGLWASSITHNQIIAFILSVVVIFSIYVMGDNSILFFVPSFFLIFFNSLLHLSNSFSFSFIEKSDKLKLPSLSADKDIFFLSRRAFVLTFEESFNFSFNTSSSKS